MLELDGKTGKPLAMAMGLSPVSEHGSSPLSKESKAMPGSYGDGQGQPLQKSAFAPQQAGALMGGTGGSGAAGGTAPALHRRSGSGSVTSPGLAPSSLMPAGDRTDVV